MALNFNCSCGEKIEVDDELAGKQARCPYCEAVVTVPTAPPKSPTAKRAKLAQPEDTDDDHGAYAGSLNPLDKSNRRSSRRRDEEEDDRPSKRRRDDEDDAEEDDRPSKRRRRDDDDLDDDYRPRRSGRYRREEPEYKLLNKQTVGGCVMMAIGVTVTVVLAFFGVYWLWMLILTVVGLISLIRGLATGRDQ
jgi:hypothetical protein